MSIKDWPSQERPRERLLKQGAKSLSDAELLAIFYVPANAISVLSILLASFYNSSVACRRYSKPLNPNFVQLWAWAKQNSLNSKR